MAFSPRGVLADPTSVTISSGTSITSALSLRGRVLVGIIMPATWTAAGITFTVSDTETGTFVDLISTAGSELALTVAASQYIAIDPVNFWGANFIKVRSGTSGTPVNQGADRSLSLMCALLNG